MESWKASFKMSRRRYARQGCILKVHMERFSLLVYSSELITFAWARDPGWSHYRWRADGASELLHLTMSADLKRGKSSSIHLIDVWCHERSLSLECSGVSGETRKQPSGTPCCGRTQADKKVLFCLKNNQKEAPLMFPLMSDFFLRMCWILNKTHSKKNQKRRQAGMEGVGANLQQQVIYAPEQVIWIWGETEFLSDMWLWGSHALSRFPLIFSFLSSLYCFGGEAALSVVSGNFPDGRACSL